MTAPFRFASANELVEITGRRARDLEGLAALLREADGGSIFYHTYQTLREHHAFVERYPNDFAQWAHEACGEEDLAEHLAGVDLRAHRSIRALRDTFVATLDAHLAARPAARTRPAREPFELCSTITVVVPTGDVAASVDEFRAVIARTTIPVLYHHFVTARLRQDLATNDFSAWLAAEAKRPDLAERIDRIDFVMRTMGEVRAALLEALA